MNILLFIFTITYDKIVSVRTADIAPQIDGFIEDLWSKSDTTIDLIQMIPYENKPPTEKTVVYLMQDDENLYMAFECFMEKNNIIQDMTYNDDHITLYLEPCNSKSVAYFFKVCASGIILDGMLLDDGRTTDKSWDGIWFHAVKIYNDRYEIEMKLPFKSLRYIKEMSEWSINIKRYIADCAESDFWTGFNQKDGFRISAFGKMVGVNPGATGYNFEIYPEGLFRIINNLQTGINITPRASLNLK